MAMKACHVWRHPTPCVTQGPWLHSTPYVVRSCVLSKGDDNKPHSMSSDTICFSREMMTHIAWCRPTMCAFQGRWWHSHAKCLTVCAAKGPWWDAMLNIVWSCVLSKGNDGMARSTSSNRVCKNRGNVKLNGKKAFYHKIYYLTLKLTFSNVLPRYSKFKNLFSFIRFVEIKNYIFSSKLWKIRNLMG